MEFDPRKTGQNSLAAIGPILFDTVIMALTLYGVLSLYREQVRMTMVKTFLNFILYVRDSIRF